MTILDRKLRRDLRAKRGQFIAVIVTIFLGITLFAASYDAFRNLEESYAAMFDETATADMTIVGGDTDAIVEDAGSLSGVAAITIRHVAEGPARIDGSHKMVVRFVGMPAANQPPVDQVMVLEGDYLDPTRSQGVLLEQHLADHFDLGPGSTIEVLTPDGWKTVEVLGVAASAEFLWPAPSRQEIIASFDDFGIVFVPDDMVAALPATTRHTEVLVRYEDGADVAALDQALTTLALRRGALDAVTLEELPSNAALSEDIKGFEEMALMFPVLFLGAAGMATSILLSRLVRAQRGQIGLLLAQGFGRRTVFGHYLRFGLVAGITGTVAGAPVGLLLGRVVTGAYTDAISVPIRITETRVTTLLIAVAFGLAAGALSAWLPAARAARIPPAAAMRGPMPKAVRHAPRLERALPPLRRLPSRWKMVLRSIGRNAGRSLTTVVGVVFAVSLVLVFWGMIDSTRVLIDLQFRQVTRHDAQVYATGPLDAPTLERLASIDGVAAIETIVDYPATLRGGGDTAYHTELQAFPSDTAMHEFRVDGRPEPLPAAGIYAGIALRDLLGIDAGDTVTLVIPDLGIEAATTLQGFVDEPLGTFAYTSRPSLEALAGRPIEPNSALVTYTPGVDREAIRATMNDDPAVAAFVDARALETMANRYMGLFYAFVGVMLVFGAVMAFALIYNTMSANISERSTEVATLRANGVHRRMLSRLLTAENVLLIVLGVLPGLFIGYLATEYFMGTFNSDLFRWHADIRASTYVLTALAILAVGFVSQRPVLRHVERLDIAQVVRERSL